jgi:hypothetical protein
VLKLGILLHVNWLAVVYAAAQGYPLLAALFSVLSAGLSLRMHPVTSVRLGLVATLIGMAGDMAVVAMGGLDFSAASPVLPVPMWMGGLWLVFGTSLPAFEPFLSKRYWLTPVLGIVGGVGAYTSAGTFGAVELGEAGRLPMVISVGLLWATAFPLLVHLAKGQNP